MKIIRIRRYSKNVRAVRVALKNAVFLNTRIVDVQHPTIPEIRSENDPKTPPKSIENRSRTPPQSVFFNCSLFEAPQNSFLSGRRPNKEPTWVQKGSQMEPKSVPKSIPSRSGFSEGPREASGSSRDPAGHHFGWIWERF